MLLHGELAPGERIELQLCRAPRPSHGTADRLALERLEDTGLLDVVAHGWFAVRGFTLDEVEGMRFECEGVLARARHALMLTRYAPTLSWTRCGLLRLKMEALDGLTIETFPI